LKLAESPVAPVAITISVSLHTSEVTAKRTVNDPLESARTTRAGALPGPRRTVTRSRATK
jgi:hypothetical protein